MPTDRNLRWAHSRGAEGFTLLEVLVAFVICAFALGGFLQVFSTSLKGADAAEDTTIATLLAESKLAAVGTLVPLDGTTSEGRFDERFRWRIETSPLDEAGGRLDRGPLMAYRVTVEVAWGAASRQRSVELISLRLAERE